MARTKKTLSMEVINQQIEEAQEAVIRAKSLKQWSRGYPEILSYNK